MGVLEIVERAQRFWGPLKVGNRQKREKFYTKLKSEIVSKCLTHSVLPSH